MSHATPDTYSALFWGYLVVWGLITAYMIYLGVKCSRLEKKLSSIDGADNSLSTDASETSDSGADS